MLASVTFQSQMSIVYLSLMRPNSRSTKVLIGDKLSDKDNPMSDLVITFPQWLVSAINKNITKHCETKHFHMNYAV